MYTTQTFFWLMVTRTTLKVAFSNFVCCPEWSYCHMTLVLTRMGKWRPEFLGHASDDNSRVPRVNSFVICPFFTSPDTYLLVIVEHNTLTRNAKLLTNCKPMFPLCCIKIAPINYHALTPTQGLATRSLTIFPCTQRVLIYSDVLG